MPITLRSLIVSAYFYHYSLWLLIRSFTKALLQAGPLVKSKYLEEVWSVLKDL